MNPEELRSAKLFMNGASQAVRLPAEFRFSADLDRVYIRRDPRTGDIILSTRPGGGWEPFFALRDELAPDKASQAELEAELDTFDAALKRAEPSPSRDPFAGWTE
jgi:antitoxin VapB